MTTISKNYETERLIISDRISFADKAEALTVTKTHQQIRCDLADMLQQHLDSYYSRSIPSTYDKLWGETPNALNVFSPLFSDANLLKFYQTSVKLSPYKGKAHRSYCIYRGDKATLLSHIGFTSIHGLVLALGLRHAGYGMAARLSTYRPHFLERDIKKIPSQDGIWMGYVIRICSDFAKTLK